MAESWRQTWIDTLDAMEADVEIVEQMIKEDHGLRELPAAVDWDPPAGLDRLPVELRPRADVILARQLEVARSLSTAITANRRQTAFADRVEVGASGKAVPSYVDQPM